MNEFEVIFYSKSDGTEPAREFLDSNENFIKAYKN